MGVCVCVCQKVFLLVFHGVESFGSTFACKRGFLCVLFPASDVLRCSIDFVSTKTGHATGPAGAGLPMGGVLHRSPRGQELEKVKAPLWTLFTTVKGPVALSGPFFCPFDFLRIFLGRVEVKQQKKGCGFFSPIATGHLRREPKSIFWVSLLDTSMALMEFLATLGSFQTLLSRHRQRVCLLLPSEASLRKRTKALAYRRSCAKNTF